MWGSYWQAAILASCLWQSFLSYLLSLNWQEAFKRKPIFSKAETPAVQPAKHHFLFPRQSCWSGDDGGGTIMLFYPFRNRVDFLLPLSSESKQASFLHSTSSAMQKEVSCALPPPCTISRWTSKEVPFCKTRPELSWESYLTNFN